MEVAKNIYIIIMQQQFRLKIITNIYFDIKNE